MNGSRRMWACLTCLVAVIGGVVALNWQWSTWAAAFALAERRPALLADVQWDEPTTARSFTSRFGPGTNESELVGWLESNDFKIDRVAARATKLIRGLPCNERIEITWTPTAANTIGNAQVRLSEAGCL